MHVVQIIELTILNNSCQKNSKTKTNITPETMLNLVLSNFVNQWRRRSSNGNL